MYNSIYANFFAIIDGENLPFLFNLYGRFSPSLLKEKHLEKIKNYMEKYHLDINSRPTLYDRIGISSLKDIHFNILEYFLEKKCANVLALLDTQDLDSYKIELPFLIERGFKKETLYENSFIHSCAQGLLDIAKYIQTQVHDINLHAHDDLALHLSCQNNQLESVQYLIEHGFKVTEQALLKSSYGASYYSLFNYPLECDDYRVFSYLLEHYDFPNLATVSDDIFSHFLSGIKYTSDKTKLHNIYLMMTELATNHQIPYTDEVARFIEDKMNVKNI